MSDHRYEEVAATPRSSTDSQGEGDAAKTPAKPASDDIIDVTVRQRLLIVCSIAVVDFIGSLDSSIVATLNPALVAEFESGADYGWYGSVFLLVFGATLPLMGKLVSIFNNKPVFLTSLLLLEMGCLICALALNSPMFIVGRAVAGLGNAGLLSSGLTIMAKVTPLEQRSLYGQIIGTLENVAFIIGPSIGGAFVNTIGWRWGFWLNLPFGAIFFGVLMVTFNPPVPRSTDGTGQQTTWQKLAQLDWIGAIAIMGSLTCLLLAMQFGGTMYSWDSPLVIGLLVAFAVTFPLIGVYETRLGDTAIFPMRLLRGKVLSAALWFGFTISSSQWAVLYYLPTWFQAVQRVSAGDAGIRIFPLSLASMAIGIIGGTAISRIGYTPPFVMAGTLFSTVGCALLCTLCPTSPAVQWIGYQILCGFGFGLGIGQSILNAQVGVPPEDVGYGITAALLVNIVGGAVAIGISQALFSSEVLRLVGRFEGVSAETLLNDFVSLGQVLSPQDLDIAVQAYSVGLKKVFLLSFVLCALSALSFPFFPWKSIKSKDNAKEEKPVGEGDDIELDGLLNKFQAEEEKLEEDDDSLEEGNGQRHQT